MTGPRCSAQHHEDGRYGWCGRPATRYTNGDVHIDALCDEDARSAIEAGAWDRGPILTGLLTWGPPVGMSEVQVALYGDVRFVLTRAGQWTWALASDPHGVHLPCGVRVADRDAARAWCERKAATVQPRYGRA